MATSRAAPLQRPARLGSKSSRDVADPPQVDSRVAIALSVAAYLIGSVSQEVSEVLRRQLARATLSNVEDLARRKLTGPLMQGQESISDERSQLDQNIGGDPAMNSAWQRRLHEADEELESRTDTAAYEVERELSLPATLLVGDRPELFAEVDRLRAEGDLRLAVCLPLLALAVLLGVAGSPLWLGAIVPVFVLFWQGVRRDFESKKLLADAMERWEIKLAGEKLLDDWVTHELPSRLRGAPDPD